MGKDIWMGNGENKESKGSRKSEESKESKINKENKMGVMPVKPLIINMSVPMMISMLVQALYNVVDSIFVAKLSEGALTAVTLAFPMQNLIISVAAGTGVGINSLLSRSLGEKRFDRADKAADNGIFLAILSALVTLVLGFTVVRPFIASQTSDPEILEYGCQYLGIVMTISAGAYFQVTFERLLQSTGLTMYSMVSQLTGAVVNIIMDPIMIFGLLGCPAMGVAGAAYATVLGQCIAAVVGLVLNLRYNREIHLSFAGIFHPEAEIIGQIYYVGIPSVLMMSIGSVMTYFMNRILGQFSSTATAVFGVYFKLQSFFFMPVFGLNNGLIPVVAYNYGAKSRPRIDEAIRFAVKLAVAIMLCGTFVMEVIPGPLLDLFSASDTMKSMGIPALRIIAIHFPIAAFGIVMGSLFQALGQSFYSLIISLARQLIALIPAAYLLSLTGNVNRVWWCFLIAETVSFTLTQLFFRRVYRRDVEPLGAAS